SAACRPMTSPARSEKPLRILAFIDPARPSTNPYLQMLYRSISDRGVEVVPFVRRSVLTERLDFWHWHWPEAMMRHRKLRVSLFRFAMLLALLVVAKFRGVTIVWTVHNLRTPTGRHPKLENLFFRIFLRFVDA